jgi:CheY-like chemotaxis protein
VVKNVNMSAMLDGYPNGLDRLVVEDDPNSVLMNSSAFTKYGAQVETARDSNVGLQKIQMDLYWTSDEV